MVKKSAFQSIVESLQSHLKIASAGEQGAKLTPAPNPSPKDPIVAENDKSGDQPTDLGELQRGVETGEPLPGVNLNPPVQEKTYDEKSPDTKIANSPIDELLTRVKANLNKLASEETAAAAGENPAPEPKEAPNTQTEKPAEAPVKTAGAKDEGNEEETAKKKEASQKEASQKEASQEEAPASEGDANKTASASVIELNTDEIARKTAEFIRYQGLGFEMANELLSAMTSDNEKTAAPVTDVTEEMIEEYVAERTEQLKTAGLNDEQIAVELQKEGAQLKEALEVKAAVEEATRQKLAAFVYQEIENLCQEGELTQKQAATVLSRLGYEDPIESARAEIAKIVNQKVAALKEAGKSDEEIKAELTKMAMEDAEAVAGVAAGDEAQLHALLSQAIAELQAAVEAGQITEEQAIGLLEEAGLNVDALLQIAAGGEAAPEASAAPAPSEGGEKKEDSKEEGEPKKDEGKKDEPKSENCGCDDKKANAPLPPELEQLVAEIDALLQAGVISQEQAIAAVEALLGGAAAPAAPADPAAAGAAPVDAAASVPPAPGQLPPVA